MIKSVIFDIGHTLVGSENPLNWSSLYRPALEHLCNTFNFIFSERDYNKAIDILTKYNTRINPREYEVSSNQIFTELLNSVNIPLDDLEQVKNCFYTFFKKKVFVYPDATFTLRALHSKGILIGLLSDVAYGMDNVYVFNDILPLKQYIDYPLTSNDVGFRKPCSQGLILLATKMNIDVTEIMFVGDEEKDIICAKNAGAHAVLINREKIHKDYKQDIEISTLNELLSFLF